MSSWLIYNVESDQMFDSTVDHKVMRVNELNKKKIREHKC